MMIMMTTMMMVVIAEHPVAAEKQAAERVSPGKTTTVEGHAGHKHQIIRQPTTGDANKLIIAIAQGQRHHLRDDGRNPEQDGEMPGRLNRANHPVDIEHQLGLIHYFNQAYYYQLPH